MQERGRARLHELWQIFADQFPAAPWLSGERLGALDILAATVSKWSGARKALAESRPEFAAIYAASAMISGAVLAGGGSWLLTRALARTGALSRFAAEREHAARADS